MRIPCATLIPSSLALAPLWTSRNLALACIALAVPLVWSRTDVGRWGCTMLLVGGVVGLITGPPITSWALPAMIGLGCLVWEIRRIATARTARNGRNMPP